MRKLIEIQKKIDKLEKEKWRIKHLKELAESDVIYTPRPLRKHEKLFLKNFDKLNVQKLCKLTGLGQSQIYSYYKSFDECKPR